MKFKKKYLRDYAPLPYRVESLFLKFNLQTNRVLVEAYMRIQPILQGQVLCLDGEAELLELRLDNRSLASGEYTLKKGQLRLSHVPEEAFTLSIVTQLFPEKNKSLMGLYASRGNLLTQCEAEGFRKITYFFDRPDVMTEYKVYIEAEEKDYPVLLSNGNLIDSGRRGKRHWALWHDPYKKPCYLFALVAGKLTRRVDIFTTQSGKKVDLHFYCRPKDADKLDFAIRSLKMAMSWDEKRFGLEYDLDLFMVVAVDDFNMGAMENKGLNIFNTKFILANPKMSTDQDFSEVEAVVGHEYFHNYTGNRVTCRDWFQLTLKEGLTVFREQEFSGDMGPWQSRRIKAIKWLREFQFAEDAGPLAHPIRPESYEQINNFYTATVYEKGAEVVRLWHTILGEERFQKGMKLYFERHDGQAVTCEDFAAALQDANAIKLPQMLSWYSQAGTPTVAVKTQFDSAKKTILLKFEQRLSSKQKKPLLIPIKFGFLTPEGSTQRFQFKHTSSATWMIEGLILLKEKKESYLIQLDRSVEPIVSIGRGFSAPIHLQYKQTRKAWLTQMLWDPDPFMRWEASQSLYHDYLHQFVKARQSKSEYPSIELLTNQLNRVIQEEKESALLALMLELPAFNELLQFHAPVKPIQLQAVLVDFKQQIAQHCAQAMNQRYENSLELESNSREDKEQDYCPHLEGVRSLINVLRSYLVWAGVGYRELFTSKAYYTKMATDMTHRLGLLEAIKHLPGDEKGELLNCLAEEFSEEDLVLDKYFTLVASSFAEDTFQQVKHCLKSNYFDADNPNRVRALLGTFIRNPYLFHRKDGKGYRLISRWILKIEKKNPMLAARLADGFKSVSQLDKLRQKLISQELDRLLAKVQSSDVTEVLSKIYRSIE
ncbi:MAG: aminopeptidase N [Neisseriaceae bacterium]